METTAPKPATTGDVENAFYARFLEIVQAEMGNPELSVDQLAATMGLGRSQFYRKINAITNSTPTVYIQRVKIKKAKSLLDGDSQMSFREIADRCGFNDYSNFVRTFKNAYGVTPTEYSRSNAGKV